MAGLLEAMEEVVREAVPEAAVEVGRRMAGTTAMTSPEEALGSSEWPQGRGGDHKRLGLTPALAERHGFVVP